MSYAQLNFTSFVKGVPYIQGAIRSETYLLNFNQEEKKMSDTSQNIPTEAIQSPARSNWQAGRPEGPVCPIDESPYRSPIEEIYADHGGQLSDRAHNFSTRRRASAK